jgi:hypothetical protein
VIAEGLPARDGSIDLLAQDAGGQLVIVLLAPGGAPHDGALLLARGLATRDWLLGDLPGWLQLLPDLEVGPDTPVRCILFCRDFDPTTRAAVAALPDGWIELAIYRPYVHAGDSFLLLEHGGAHSLGGAKAARPTRLETVSSATVDGMEDRGQPAFRSGLSESEFELSRAERRSLSSGAPPRPRYSRDELAHVEPRSRGN